MASGTINLNNSSTTSGGGYLAGKIVWSSEADVANNESTVTAKLYVKKAATSGTLTTATTGTWSHTLSIGGKSTSDSSSKSVLNSWVLVQTKTVTIAHDDSGEKRITISGSVTAPGGTAYAGKKTSGSKTVALDTIARASVPTVSASSVRMGSKLTITTNRKASSFTHTLKYSFGDKSGTIATGVGASYTWTVPDLAAYCNNATSGSCTITCITYSGSTKVGTKTIEVTLTVPSATTPTFSATTVNMGSSVTVYVKGKGAANFTHKVSYNFAGKTGVIYESLKSSVKWSVPYSLAAAIPSATSGTCTITCVTYNGTAKVGTTTAEITLKVPNNSTTKPKVSMSLSPSHSLGDAFDGLYIRNKSKVVSKITASSDYSEVASYKQTVGSKTKTSTAASITSDLLSTSGSVTVKGIAEDARGYENSISESITVIAYSKPTVIPYTGESGIVCRRCAADGTINDSGAYLLIRAGRKYSTVTADGIQKNFCILRCRYKVASADNYSDWMTIIAKDSTDSNVFSGRVEGVELDVRTSYNVQIGVADDVGESYRITFDIPTDTVAFHVKEGGKAVAFGKYAEEDNVLEIAEDWNLHVRGNAEIDGSLSVAGSQVADFVIEAGYLSDDTVEWRYRKWKSGTYDLYGMVDVTPTSSTETGNGAAYYSEQITVTLPFAIKSCIFTGVPAGGYAWLTNCVVVNTDEHVIGFRIFRFAAVNSSTYTIRIIAHGRWA